MLKEFPILFNWEETKPLKIGISEELSEKLGVLLPIDRIKSAIRYYVRSMKYTETFVKSSHRYDLEGKISGEISEQNLTDATKYYEGLKAFFAKKNQKTEKEEVKQD